MRTRTCIVFLAIVAAACSGSGEDTTTTAPPITSTTAPVVGESPTTTSSLATIIAPPTTDIDDDDGGRPPTTTESTQPRRTTTTTRPPSDGSAAASSRPPTVSITSPGNLTRHVATYDAGAGTFFATVSFSAAATDPDGDPVTIEWYSDTEGFLGTGTSITARLRPFGDASQPVITAVATDSHGASSQASQQIVVWIPSDQ